MAAFQNAVDEKRKTEAEQRRQATSVVSQSALRLHRLKTQQPQGQRARAGCSLWRRTSGDSIRLRATHTQETTDEISRANVFHLFTIRASDSRRALL